MDAIAIMELIKLIGGALGSVLTVSAVLTLFVKPIREKFAKWINKTANTQEFENKFTDINGKIDNLTTLVEKSIEQNEKLQAEMELQSKALLSDTRKIILDMCNEITDKGYMSMYESETLSALYESYDALHGNTFVHGMVQNVFSTIPVRRNGGGD